MGLVDDALGGSKRALARLATHFENDDDLAATALELLYPKSGRAHVVGVTGPPGAGKSSLVNLLVAALRAQERTVAVLAIDPSSPLTGGATLGDRIRMLDVQSDLGVFIRSTASRGRTGGLAPTTNALIHLFDAVGYDVVIVETVGIGQEEVDIARCVDTVLLVQVPGLGDGVQALKAGVLEIADIYVVNKADLPGAESTSRELRALLTLTPGHGDWAPPVVSVSSKEAAGIDRLIGEVIRHHDWLVMSGVLDLRRAQVARTEVAQQMQRLMEARLDRPRQADDAASVFVRVADRRQTPRSAAEEILARWSAVD